MPETRSLIIPVCRFACYYGTVPIKSTRVNRTGPVWLDTRCLCVFLLVRYTMTSIIQQLSSLYMSPMNGGKCITAYKVWGGENEWKSLK